jgi:hypothetical protein
MAVIASLAALAMVAALVVAATALSRTPRQNRDGGLVAGSRQGQMSDWSIRSVPNGVTDFSALVVNDSRSPITALRAQAIPADNFPTPRFVGAAIGTPAVAYSGRGWPVRDAPSQLLPATVPPGRTWLYFSVTGSTLGVDYMTLGVRLTYKQRGHLYSVNVWGPSVTCVRAQQNADDARCARDGRRALDLADARAEP